MKKGYLIFNAIFVIPSIIMIVSNGITALPILLILASLLITGGLIISDSIKKEQDDIQTTIKSNIENIKDFSPSNIQQAANCIIALDEDRSKIAIADTTGTYVYSFDKIIESEILQDEVSISKVSRTGQIGGALLGGVLAGGVGAVIGGLSSSKQSETQVKNITLKIIVDDLRRPYMNVQFLSSDIPLKSTSIIYTKALEDATQWQSIMSVIMKRNQKQSING